jgi:RND family efflux transporter MFP subunit
MHAERKQRLRQFWRKAWRPLVGVVVLVGFIAWASGALQKKVAPGEVAAQPGLPLPPGAEQIEVALQSYAPAIDVVGTTASAVMVHISARVSAYVKEVKASAGQRVKAGDLLVRLDDREFSEQVSAAEAQLQQVESEYHRTRQLLEKNATTEQAMIAAESAFHTARAQAERVRVMLTYTALNAPLDGVVTDRRVEPGDLANPGQVLLSVYDPTRMRLEAPVPVRLVEKLQLDASVEVALDRPAGVLTGRVAQIVSEIDPSSRTQLVKVDIAGENTAILPGTFGRLWVPDDARDAILVPGSAVYRVGQLELVHLVRGDRVLRRAVTTGARVGERVEILAGLREKDVVLRHPIIEDHAAGR